MAKPMLEADSHAKVQMRNKVRGLRAIEREVLAQQRTQTPSAPAEGSPEPVGKASVPAPQEASSADSAGAVVLDYCTAIRGILNSDQGGPLQPPGIRMAEALGDVRQSIQRNLDKEKRGLHTNNSIGLAGASTEVWPRSPKRKR